MNFTTQDNSQAMECFMHDRRGDLTGAIAVRLASMTDSELGRVPYDRALFVDWEAVICNDHIEAADISLPRIDRSCNLVDPKDVELGHSFVLGFTYCLCSLGDDREAVEAHESPYQEKWAAMSRDQMLRLLVSHMVRMDPIYEIAREIDFD